jgi:hypothetical protein
VNCIPSTPLVNSSWSSDSFPASTMPPLVMMGWSEVTKSVLPFRVLILRSEPDSHLLSLRSAAVGTSRFPTLSKVTKPALWGSTWEIFLHTPFSSTTLDSG